MRVEEIRPSELMAAQQRSMQADIDWLARHRDRMVDVACPACGGAEHESLYDKHGLRHVRCVGCRTQYVSPRIDLETMRRFYAESQNYAFWATHIFPASAQARREKIFRPRAAMLERLAERQGLNGAVLLEVGAGYGLFCDEARKLGRFRRIIGIEPTPALARVCRELGLECIESSYETANLDEPVDVIAAFEVIEHLFSPLDFLGWCRERLRPGGSVLLTCPNIAGFETSVLGRDSETVDHEHVNLFNPDSLAALARRAGFAEAQVTTPGQLDVDIVQTALHEGRVDEHRLGGFLVRLLREGAPDALAAFQEFLRAARLSSNMAMTASTPAP